MCWETRFASPYRPSMVAIFFANLLAYKCGRLMAATEGWLRWQFSFLIQMLFASPFISALPS